MPNAPFTWGPQGPQSLQPGTIQLTNGHFLGNDGPKNYIGNATFENGTTNGWSLGAVGSMTNSLPTGTPTFGSGGSANMSLAVVSTGQIAGNFSLNLSYSAFTTSGFMFASDPMTIDAADQANVINYSFNYKAVSFASSSKWDGSTFSQFGVAVYDVTNSAWLPVTNPLGFIANPIIGTISGSFQTAYNTSVIRLVIYNPNNVTQASTAYFDDFVVGPAPVNNVIGPISFNGTQSSQAVTSATDITFTVVKDSSGAWNGTQFVVPQAGDYVMAGTIAANGSTSPEVFKNGSNVTNAQWSSITSSGQNSGGAILVPNCQPGDKLSLRSSQSVTVSFGNLSIYQVQSAGVGPAGQAVASRAHVSSGVSTAANNPINFDVIDFDTTGSITTGVTTWKYTCPYSGIYEVTALNYYGATDAITVLYKNGSLYCYLAESSNSTVYGNGSTGIQCNAGDTLSIRPNVTATPTVGNDNYVFIRLIQGPSSQTATPTVAASYWVSANFAASTTVPINFDSKEYDYTNSVTTSATAWKFTAPYSGLYSVSVVTDSTTLAGLFIYKDGSSYKWFGQTTQVSGNGQSQTTSIRLNANDAIDIRPGTSATIVGGALNGAGTGNISITRVGN